MNGFLTRASTHSPQIQKNLTSTIFSVSQSPECSEKKCVQSKQDGWAAYKAWLWITETPHDKMIHSFLGSQVHSVILFSLGFGLDASPESVSFVKPVEHQGNSMHWIMQSIMCHTQTSCYKLLFRLFIIWALTEMTFSIVWPIINPTVHSAVSSPGHAHRYFTVCVIIA